MDIDRSTFTSALRWVATLVDRGVACDAIKHLATGVPATPVTLQALHELGTVAVPRPVLVAVLLAYAREHPHQLLRASRMLDYLDDPKERDAALTFGLRAWHSL